MFLLFNYCNFYLSCFEFVYFYKDESVLHIDVLFLAHSESTECIILFPVICQVDVCMLC